MFARNVLAGALVAVGGLACSSDHDCSLNGVCDASSMSCVCDEPWSGPSCGVILTEPARSQGIYGYAPNVSSWGGSIVRSDDGRYHLYVAEMVSGGLVGWSHQSECTHAESSTISGPFAKADVAVSKWCHNPAPIRDPLSGEFLMFHIGQGNETPSSGFMHHSAKANGPWVPAKTSPGSCNNPAPAFHPNGTLFLICDHMYITSAATWDQEWTSKRRLGGSWSDKDRHFEDPTLWIDARGHFHILYHVYCLQPFSSGKECYSGHAFSEDGQDWTFSDVEPFNGTVDFTDGSSITFSTRERPQVIFANDDSKRVKPVAVVSAVSSQPIGPMCDSCYDHTCSQCKITSGRDWTYTVLQPFKGFSAAFPEEDVRAELDIAI